MQAKPEVAEHGLHLFQHASSSEVLILGGLYGCWPGACLHLAYQVVTQANFK